MKEDIQRQAIMEKLSNLDKIKEQTKIIARAIPIKKESNLPIAIHPFTSEIIWTHKMMKDKVNEINESNISKYDLSKKNVYEEWLKEFDLCIDKCDDILNIYMFWRDAWKLTFMKYCGDYLSKKDYAEYLAHSWVVEENPNMDANVPISESIKMFKSCKKEFLMEKDDFEYWKSMPNEVILYRGVSKGRVKLGLSWTDDKEMAKWFMNRWDDSKNCLLTVKANKKDIIAYFNTRNENEFLLDVLKYKDKIKVVHKI